MADESDQFADVDFVKYVVTQLVTDPSRVDVSRSVDEMGVLITLKVSKDDMGRIIGKNGQTAKAIRVLLRVIGSKNHARVNLKIVEPGGGEAHVESSEESAPMGDDASAASADAGESAEM